MYYIKFPIYERQHIHVFKVLYIYQYINSLLYTDCTSEPLANHILLFLTTTAVNCCCCKNGFFNSFVILDDENIDKKRPMSKEHTMEQ